MNSATRSDISAVMEKIKKLISLASSPNEYEANRANQKVQELLLLHNMSMGDIHQDDAEEVTEEVLFTSSRSVKWRQYLVAAVADFYDCQSMGFKSRSGIATSIVGSPSNVAVAIAMVEYFTKAVDRVAKEDKARGISITLTYRYGVAVRIAQKIRERKAVVRAEGFTTETGSVSALAVQAQSTIAKKESDQFIAKKYPRSRDVAVKSNGNRGALRDGFDAGDRVGIDSQMGGGSGQRQLSASNR